MSALALAQQYMELVFTRGDFIALRPLLADSLSFQGPWYCFNTADDYINALLSDPPQDFAYKMLKTYEDDTSACLVYQFIKPGVATIMMQLFEIKDDKINSILLLFDTAAFNNHLEPH
ncbi:MAG: hypothetical protein SVR94_13840 [Pseudomonadota bacterium]|nr:hypothetical protein [Pseudomonadota bacterium]